MDNPSKTKNSSHSFGPPLLAALMSLSFSFIHSLHSPASIDAGHSLFWGILPSHLSHSTQGTFMFILPLSLFKPLLLFGEW